jgi:hypothetical protein
MCKLMIGVHAGIAHRAGLASLAKKKFRGLSI